MGVGIFLWVEQQLPSGAWSMVEREEARLPSWQREFDESDEAEGRPIQHTWEIGKNYNLFAIIADHCNNRLAGRFTEHVISSPRGIPPDLSDGVLEDWCRIYPFGEDKRATRTQRLQILEKWEALGDIVAPSWVTVAELLAVNWHQATHGKGVSGEEGDFLTMLHEELVPLGQPDHVRLVFYFDS